MFENLFLKFKSHYDRGQILSIEQMQQLYPELDQKLLSDWFELVIEHGYLKKIGLDKKSDFTIHSATELKKILGENFLSQEELTLSFEILALKNKVNWNYKSPFASFYFNAFGISVRITVIHGSCTATNIPKMFIRVLSYQALTMDHFTSDEKCKTIVGKIVENQHNFIICGSTGSGKTALTNQCLGMINHQEHIVLLEDVLELNCKSPNWTQLLASDGVEKKGLKDFCAYVMRMSPDRIILGEIRSHEIVPLMLAMNTGHKGTISTVHASSAIDAIHRLTLLYSLYSGQQQLSSEIVQKYITKNIHHVIFMENKKIKEIIEVKGSQGNNCIYEKLWEASFP